MDSIKNIALLNIISGAINNNTQVSKSELSNAYSAFKDEVIARVDAIDDMCQAYRLVGYLQIELKTLRDGIIAPNCEAGEKCSHRIGVS